MMVCHACSKSVVGSGEVKAFDGTSVSSGTNTFNTFIVIGKFLMGINDVCPYDS